MQVPIVVSFFAIDWERWWIPSMQSIVQCIHFQSWLESFLFSNLLVQVIGHPANMITNSVCDITDSGVVLLCLLYILWQNLHQQSILNLEIIPFCWWFRVASANFLYCLFMWYLWITVKRKILMSRQKKWEAKIIAICVIWRFKKVHKIVKWSCCWKILLLEYDIMLSREEYILECIWMIQKIFV